MEIRVMTDRGGVLAFKESGGVPAIDQATEVIRGMVGSPIRTCTINFVRPKTPSPGLGMTQPKPQQKSKPQGLTVPALNTPPRAMNLRDFLSVLVTNMGLSQERWRYISVTSAQVRTWTGWSTSQAKGKLDWLVEKGYAVKDGRQDASRRVESHGTTCVTYSLRSDRVKRFLGI